MITCLISSLSGGSRDTFDLEMDPFPPTGTATLADILTHTHPAHPAHPDADRDGAAPMLWDDVGPIATHTDIRRLADIGLMSEDRGTNVDNRTHVHTVYDAPIALSTTKSLEDVLF